MAPRRARRVRPAPPGAGARHRVHDPVRPRPAGDRPGPGPDLDRARLRGPEATKQRRLKADAVTFETGRPGVFGTGDVRIGAATVVQADRRGPPRGLRRRRLPQGHGPVGDPDPPDARRAAARVPLDRAVHERGQGAALPDEALEAEERNHSYIEYELPYTPRGGGRRVDALPPVHLRGDRLLRPAPPRDRVRDDAQDARAAVPPGRRLPERDREPLHRRQPRLHPRRLATPSSCASRRAASTAAAAPRSAPRSSAPPATTSCGSASTRWSRRRST